MNIKSILLRYFLPLMGCFLGLSILNTLPSVQQVYSPILEKISIDAMTRTQSDIFFKAKKEANDQLLSTNQLTVYFNSKKQLQRMYDEAKVSGQTAHFNYKGFPIELDKYYITPLIFFFSLLLISPFKWFEKIASFLIGGGLLMGFAYWTVIVKGYFMIAIAGLPDMIFTTSEMKYYTLLHYLFGTVTTISLVLIMWLTLMLGTNKWQLLLGIEERIPSDQPEPQPQPQPQKRKRRRQKSLKRKKIPNKKLARLSLKN